VGVVRKRVGFAIFWLVLYYVIIRIMSRNSGSKFGWILGWNMKLQRSRSTSWRFWSPSYGWKTPNLV